MGQRWRVHHGDLPREAGSVIRLDPSESHHACRVLRRRPGDRLDVFDGAGREWSTVIEGGGPRELAVRLVREIHEPVESPLEVVLFQAVCRPDRMDWVIQKATELGFAAIRPVAVRDARGGDTSSARLDRWRRIALEASKQCGRRFLPDIAAAPELPGAPANALALLLHERASATPLGELLDGAAPGAVWLAVGPESGFSDDEVARAVGLGWRKAGLGPRTLRTETAALVAGAIVLHRWADIGRAG